MKGLIAWFARNGVAANLLMVGIMAAGLLSLPRIKREVFPDLPSDQVSVTVLYPGAAPEEVEEAICIRIEEAVQSLDGVKHIRSISSENTGRVVVEALEGTDIARLLDDVKARVDGIDTFPEEAEQPVIAQVVRRRQVLNVAISGKADELTLKRMGERVRDEILALPGVTQADLVNTRPYEISIEVSEEALRKYGLSFQDLVTAVRRSSFDLPGGSVKTRGGEILLRSKGQAYHARDFESLPLLTAPDGTRILLGDVARVIDGFADTDQFSTFNDEPSCMVQVFRVGDQDALHVARAVRRYMRDARGRLPEGIHLTLWQDQAQLLQSRQSLLVRNGRAGFLLVFLVLALFLRFRLAFWVSMGIPLSFLGALWVMPALGVSINMISLFAFIIVLGIVVDDAIVVGESVNQQLEGGKNGVEAAINGTQEVSVPVTFAFLTTVAAFGPLLFVTGTIGQIMRVIPLIVIPTLLFSFIESKLILPNHLSHLKPEESEAIGRRWSALWKRLRAAVDRGLRFVILRVYSPSLEILLRWRYLTVAGFVFLLLLTVGLVGSGAIKFVFFPKVEADRVTADLTMPLGTPVEVTAQAVGRLEKAATTLRKELGTASTTTGQDMVRNILSSVGSQPFQQTATGPEASPLGSFSAAHLGEVTLELIPSEDRSVTSPEIARRWRELTGPIPDAIELSFSSSIFHPGSAIEIQLAGRNVDELGAAAEEVKRGLAKYRGVSDITDTYRTGKREIKLRMKPEAEVLGLTLADLATQVRYGFYGAEAQRVQRGRDEVKVMIRYPEAARHSLSGLQNMRIRTPSGLSVPFSTVAETTLGRGYSSINRVDRRRTISVIADVDSRKGNSNEILADAKAGLLPSVLADHPGVTYSFEGQQQQQRETMGGLVRGFALAILIIYSLLAVVFRSYLQPLVVMTAIPFGVIGAIWGHLLMGMNLAILSMFGIVALTGVVVNDSIVLVDFVNRRRREGIDLRRAVQEAGIKRFRPILLTSLTTVAGLTPILLEKSMQAQFLKPVAISLGFGVLFATLITLGMIPAAYLILEDMGRLVRRAVPKK